MADCEKTVGQVTVPDQTEDLHRMEEGYRAELAAVGEDLHIHESVLDRTQAKAADAKDEVTL